MAPPPTTETRHSINPSRLTRKSKRNHDWDRRKKSDPPSFNIQFVHKKILLVPCPSLLWAFTLCTIRIRSVTVQHPIQQRPTAAVMEFFEPICSKKKKRGGKTRRERMVAFWKVILAVVVFPFEHAPSCVNFATATLSVVELISLEPRPWGNA